MTPTLEDFILACKCAAGVLALAAVGLAYSATRRRKIRSLKVRRVIEG